MDKRKLTEKILFPFLDIFLNAFNYGFHIYTSWYLLREEYGILNAHLALISLIMVIGIALQLNGAKVSAGVNLKLQRVYLPNPFLITGIPLLLIILSSFWLKEILRGTLLDILMIVIIFIFHSLLSSYRGILQGQSRFYKLNISFYIEVVVKVLLLYLLLPKYRNIVTPLVAILSGYILSTLHIYFFHIRRIRRSILFHGFKTILKDNYFIIFILSQFLIYSLFSVDMILINKLHPGFAPDYAVIQKVGMIQFFIGSSIMSVFLPELSKTGGDISEFTHKWKFFLIILISVLLIGQVFYFFIVPPLIPYLFGEKYVETAKYIPYGGVLFAILVISNFFVTSLLSRGNRTFPPLIFIGMIFVSISIFFLKTITGILLTEIVIYLLVSLGLYIIIKKDIKNE